VRTATVNFYGPGDALLAHCAGEDGMFAGSV